VRETGAQASRGSIGRGAVVLAPEDIADRIHDRFTT
jgi:hypothetical protein